jgi:cytochrome c oxidase cbb3-type subunit 2
MPSFPWLAESTLDTDMTGLKMERLRMVGVPYSDDEIGAAAKAVDGKTEMDALIAYLQVLGISSRQR